MTICLLAFVGIENWNPLKKMDLSAKWEGTDNSGTKVFFVRDETYKEIMASFRALTSQGTFNDNIGAEGGGTNRGNMDGASDTLGSNVDGFLCFRVVLRHHKPKHKNEAPEFYICCKDTTPLSALLAGLEARVKCDSATSTFMTKESFGIQSQQSAASAFMKHGNEIELHTGIHLNAVGWA